MGLCCSWFSASHGLQYAKPSRVPPDPELFPRYLQNKQGLWLHFAEWAPPREAQKVRGVLFIISGLAEHTARYDSAALKFAREGYHCFCLDNQGSGGSEGRRLYVENFYDFVDDFELFKKHIFAKHPEYASLPCFLFGHSMGGLIATHVALREPSAWSAVVLSGPALEADPALATPFMRGLVRMFSRCLPKLGVQRLDSSLSSRNRQVVEFNVQDPFYFSNSLTARWGAEMLRAMDDVWVNMERSTFPLLILHGTQDRLCSINGSRRLLNSALSRDKKLIEYEGMYHEVFREVKWRDVLQDVQAFLDSHCSC